MTNENETVEQVCEDIKIECSPNTSALIYLINRVPDIIAAHKRELAAKDAEIAKRDALIKELADALVDVTYHKLECIHFPRCETCRFTCECGSRMSALVAKAREALS